MNFDLREYIASLKVDTNDSWFKDTTRWVELGESVVDDAYLARALFWGVASAMENQLVYLGNNFRVNLTNQLQRLIGNGILSEDDVSVFKFANELRPHINEDRSKDDLIADKEAQIAQVDAKMYVAAVLFVHAVRKHDEISLELNQLTYSAIKARASQRNSNRTQMDEKVVAQI